jgi:hypothetical protein
MFNNSWVGDAGGSVLTEIQRRADFAVVRDDVLMISGMDNLPSGNDLMHLMFNGINVGKTNGTHQTGPTSDGRIKPEIVAQQNLTSFATPKVSAVLALLVETARSGNIAGNPDAERSEVLKAVLLAGAKHRSLWTNNPATSGPSRGVTSQPLDSTFGADEADVNRSHLILTGGEQNGANGAPSAANAIHRGWDSTTVGIGSSKFWRLCVRQPADEVSVVATWHLDVAASSPRSWAIRALATSHRATSSARARWTTSSTCSSRGWSRAST